MSNTTGDGAPSAFRPLLPNEPRLLNASTQAHLTAQYLLPALAELESFFFAVRAWVDPVQQKQQPLKLGKPYPLGQCLEITLTVQKLLRTLDATQLDSVAAQGHAAFSAFLAAGGGLRQVWGDLRGQFFQNAFLLGTLYVDVSNDTVTPTKPKVEILPFAESGLTAITDFRHFGELAQRYWHDQVFPNHVLPALAPYYPLVHVSPTGLVLVREPTNYMVALAQAGQFVPSEEVLRAPAMPAALFDYVARALAGTKFKLADSPDAGRAQALRMCREYRRKRWHSSQSQSAKIKRELTAANGCLIAASAKLGPYLATV